MDTHIEYLTARRGGPPKDPPTDESGFIEPVKGPDGASYPKINFSSLATSSDPKRVQEAYTLYNLYEIARDAQNNPEARRIGTDFHQRTGYVAEKLYALRHQKWQKSG